MGVERTEGSNDFSPLMGRLKPLDPLPVKRWGRRRRSRLESPVREVSKTSSSTAEEALPESDHKESQWIAQKGILERRGWTMRLIEGYLGDPDRTPPNPVYRRAAPIKLWKLSRVLEVEKDPAWIEQAKRVEEKRGRAWEPGSEETDGPTE